MSTQQQHEQSPGPRVLITTQDPSGDQQVHLLVVSDRAVRDGEFPGYHGGVPPARLTDRILADFIGRGAGRRFSLMSDLREAGRVAELVLGLATPDEFHPLPMQEYAPRAERGLPKQERAARAAARFLAATWKTWIVVGRMDDAGSRLDAYGHWAAHEPEKVLWRDSDQPWQALGGESLGIAFAGAVQELAIGNGAAAAREGADPAGVVTAVIRELARRAAAGDHAGEVGLTRVAGARERHFPGNARATYL